MRSSRANICDDAMSCVGARVLPKINGTCLNAEAVAVCRDHTVYSNRSAARMKLAQHGFAITDALSCCALAPTWPKGYYRLGMALAAVTKYSEAADHLRKSLALSPADATIRSALEETEKAAAKAGIPAGRGYLYTWGAAEAIGRGAGCASSRGGSTTTPKMLEGIMGAPTPFSSCERAL